VKLWIYIDLAGIRGKSSRKKKTRRKKKRIGMKKSSRGMKDPSRKKKDIRNNLFISSSLSILDNNISSSLPSVKFPWLLLSIAGLCFASSTSGLWA
jgi:hypothetical protein